MLCLKIVVRRVTADAAPGVVVASRLVSHSGEIVGCEMRRAARY